MQISPINSYQNQINFNSRKVPLITLPKKFARTANRSPVQTDEVVMTTSIRQGIKYYLIKVFKIGQKKPVRVIKTSDEQSAINIYVEWGQALISAKSRASQVPLSNGGIWTSDLKLKTA